MNLSAISRRSAVGRLLRLPLRLIPSEARMPILQGRLRGNRWIAGAGNHGCWLGSYELATRHAIEARVPRGATFFDVGANAGYYTLLASELVGPEGKVVAFEPLPANLDYLERHLRLNQRSNVTVVSAAVSDRRGALRFSPGPDRSMGKLEPGGELEVEAVTLDQAVYSDHRPLPDFLKIDVEGAETEVLAGGQRLFSEHRPTLFLSTHGRELHERCCRRLKAWGYRLESLSGEALEDSDEILAEARR